MDGLKPEILQELEELRATVLKLGQFAEEQRAEIEELKELAFKDPLLGDLLNRRGFEEAIRGVEEEERRDEEREEEVTMIFIDVDKFKNINDTYSHSVGDKVLLALAKIVLEEARAEDTLFRCPKGAISGRMGGEEIVIALPGADEEGARAVLQRIQKKVEKIEIETKEGPIQFTISAGIGKSMEDADKAMYVDKSIGQEAEQEVEE